MKSLIACLRRPTALAIIVMGAYVTMTPRMRASFGSGGVVTTSIGAFDDIAYDVAVQSDGKILLAGTTNKTSNSSDGASDLALVRYDANGGLDASFGSGGKVVTVINAFRNECLAMALQNDGKILVSGYSYQTNGTQAFLLVRYNGNGSLDSSFGIGGKVTTALSGAGFSVAVQGDGKILVAGFSTLTSFYASFALIRYNADGSLDAGFGSGGKITTAIGTGDAFCYGMALQPDGKILLVGYSSISTSQLGADFALVRYNANGSLDSTFGNGGKVVTAVSPVGDIAIHAALQADGKIVVVGQVLNGSHYDGVLARYNSNGTLDTSFGSGGLVSAILAPTGGWYTALAITDDGKIVVSGGLVSQNGSASGLALARYNSNGNLDTTFGSGGKVTTQVGSLNAGSSTIALQSDHKILLGGNSAVGSNADFILVRYNSDGSLDSVTAPVTPGPVIAIQPKSLVVNAGGMVSLTVGVVDGTGVSYQWRKNDVNISGATNATLILNQVGSGDAAAYSVVVTKSGGSTTSATATLTVTAGKISRISNLSVRTNLANGQGVTVGFVTSGAKNLLIRAVGPSLKTVFGLTNFYADPKFSVVSGGAAIDQNDNWPVNLASTFASLGAFPLDAGSKDAALVRPVTGANTAEVNGTGSGIMLAELYDTDAATASFRLTNVSARNQVGTGTDILVAGFVIDGTAARTLLIRGIGPGLHDVFGLNGFLADPVLEIHQTINGVDTVIASNDNWDAGLTPIFDKVGAYRFTAGSKDAALLITLPPGVYTAQVAGANNGTGDGVVEVYEVP